MARAIQEERLHDAESRRRPELAPRVRPERPDPWGAILRIPRYRLADANG